MCDACAPAFNRRSLLRGVVLGGAVVAAGSLRLPARAGASASGSGTFGSADSNGMESASMAEDQSPSVAPAGTPATRGTRMIPAPNLDAIKAPPIVTRAQWGANESIRRDARVFAPVRKLIVHHTASANKPANPAAVVRLVEEYHESGKGFSDTGYNFLIDHRGAIYEGRAARKYGSHEAITGEDNKGWGVVGAHAKGYNAGSCGICMIGNFDTGSPTDAALNSLVWLMAWKAGRQRIDAHGNDDYIDIYGGHHTTANISGHRQVGQTDCPGSNLYKLLPTLRDEVAQQAGAWDPLVVDIPGVLRHEYGHLRAPSTTTTAPPPATNAATPPATATTTPATATAGNGSGTGTGTGTKLTGIRIVSTTGAMYTVGAARDLGSPSGSGIKQVVALANTSHGDGYWVLGNDGKVAAFGGLGTHGDAAGKGIAIDLVATPSGSGYWVLTADGGIYPFGDAGYASSPKKAGIGGTALRMATRPQGDGYWVLMADGSVHAFGAAPKLGSASGTDPGVDLWATPMGGGYVVLTKSGRIVVFGDAVDKGDLKRAKVKWSRSVSRVVGTPSGKGYVIINTEGSMVAFGDAPAYPSLGGSGITAAGVAPAFG